MTSLFWTGRCVWRQCTHTRCTVLWWTRQCSRQSTLAASNCWCRSLRLHEACLQIHSPSSIEQDIPNTPWQETPHCRAPKLSKRCSAVQIIELACPTSFPWPALHRRSRQHVAMHRLIVVTTSTFASVACFYLFQSISLCAQLACELLGSVA